MVGECRDICVEDLTVAYGPEIVLDRINVIIQGGTSTAVLGVSGRGKSTFLRSLAGLSPAPTQGKVLIGGESPRNYHKRKGLWFLFQEPVTFANRTVVQHLNAVFEFHGANTDTVRAIRLLEMTGLTSASTKYPCQLSVGMRARLALAMSFCVPPEILFADEPFSSLDSGYRRTLNDSLTQLQEESGTTVVWITHEVRDATDYADRILVFAGRPATICMDKATLRPHGYVPKSNSAMNGLCDEIDSVIENDRIDE
jgi:NitT/TauT family transport system ATP-binding protein